MDIGWPVRQTSNACVRQWNRGKAAFSRVYKNTNRISLKPATKVCQRASSISETEHSNLQGILM